ncbi:MAG: hypothetical protein Q7J38_12475 [Gallionella sp.]|nr:hypothetical protein [Gallionella sp.]
MSVYSEGLHGGLLSGLTGMDYLAGLALGILSGVALTLMDRIDEHRIIERHRAPLAYLAALATAASMAWSVELFPVLYPMLFGLCVGWIVKNKIDFPSHVFSLFLLALYFGARLDLLLQFFPYIALFVAIRHLSGTVLRKKFGGRLGFFWFYASYWEKVACDLVLAIALSSALPVVYGVGFSAACLWVKRLLPGRKMAGG